MKFDKWLKRKYPKNYNLILDLYKDVNELEYMSDRSKYVIAMWDGSDGGTKNCVEYANKTGKIITGIEP